MNNRAIQDSASFGFTKSCSDKDEYEHLVALQAMGLASQEELARLEELSLTESIDSRLTEDLEHLAVELMSCTPADLPRKLLRDRVFVATEPKLANVATDADGCIVAVSKGFTELCGYTFEEVRGKRPGSFLQGPNTDPAAAELLREAIREGKRCSVNLINYHKSGHSYLANIDLKPIIGRNGRLEGFKATATRIEPESKNIDDLS